MAILGQCALVVSALLLAAANDRPNFIIVQPDDMPFWDEWDPPANAPAEPDMKMPAPSLPYMDRLRSEGVIFSSAYVVSPACGTSRFATMTGRYPSRSESGREKSSKEDRTETTIPTTKLQGSDCENSIPSALQGAGYRTGVTGKWHLSSIEGKKAPAYAEQQEAIKQCGFDYADGIYLENFASGTFADSGEFSHNMEWVTAKAIEFIESTPAEQPFYLYFNPTVPHGPGVREALKDYTCKQTPAGNLDAEPSVPGMTGNTTCAKYRRSIISRSPKDEEQEDDDLGSIWTDDALGALITTLDAKGVLDNTFIVLMMDHGMETKMALFENGLRVSLAVRYPAAFAKGTVYDGLVTNVDLAQTVLDMAGATPSYELDGRSWFDEVSSGADASKDWKKRCVFFEYEKDRAARCGCLKLISIGDTGSSTTVTRAGQLGYSGAANQLYNLCKEGEASDLFDDALASLEQMQEALECHDTRTRPSAEMDFAACARKTDGQQKWETGIWAAAAARLPRKSPAAAGLAALGVFVPTLALLALLRRSTNSAAARPADSESPHGSSDSAE